MTVVASVALTVVPAALAKSRRAVQFTSLTAAWWWTAGAATAWIAVWTATWLARALEGWTDLAWYVVAVAMLCPPVAVLGARRPGAGAWTWFVVLPLLIVLSLPAVTAAALAGPAEGFTFQLEAPWAIGYVLVLVMGAGNYVGTRMTLPAMVYAAAAALLVGPLTEATAEWFPSAAWSRRGAALCVGLSAGLALCAGRTRLAAGHPLDGVWRDFRDWFGVVWSRRVMERTNLALADRDLQVRLEWTGLVWHGPPAEPVEEIMAEARRHAEHTLRWLLKRFVEPEWIDARLRKQG